ncbi:MAG: M20/M25/M40 family metallo-hydrolase, partial [Gammaproteobacteria bacterium]|nr:M20/M25/M40 family metallo-hydrolase [Gammaproteobacteria bacterium]
MLIGQPAEEAIGGANLMMQDDLWQRFGQPDYALAFHVSSEIPLGKIKAVEGSPYSGVDSVDLIVHGIGGHGASPHATVDPIVLASQIVLSLQTLVSRTLPPREPGVITVGSFHSGTKHNIISDQAKLQITVRNESEETRETLLNGIRRIAENLGRAAGLPDDKLPEVIVRVSDRYPPTLNDIPLTRQLKEVWSRELGEDIFHDDKRLGMGAEDFPFFTTDPYIPSTYFAIGGTPQTAIDAAAGDGPAVPSHHSPLFRIEPRGAVTLGVEATVLALMELLQPQ